MNLNLFEFILGTLGLEIDFQQEWGKHMLCYSVSIILSPMDGDDTLLETVKGMGGNFAKCDGVIIFQYSFSSAISNSGSFSNLPSACFLTFYQIPVFFDYRFFLMTKNVGLVVNWIRACFFFFFKSKMVCFD